MSGATTWWGSSSEGGQPYPLVARFSAKKTGNSKVGTPSLDKDLFYFKFSLVEDMRQILEADPIYITGKLFVIRKGHRRWKLENLLSKHLPVWATKLRQRLNFAKFCVEVPVDHEYKKSVRIKMNEKEMDIDLEYPWIPLLLNLQKIWAQSGQLYIKH
ncbi:hypothetical protein IFM89_030496 [Coptis chinensis]|uniref:DUF4283 domain-containing protein n=1 Tax=Coptis chinensis TaxID=261450 RepID=A0A835LJ52_9MAGN|nr:hypothetical protein IFM89_030496 [Coptis chinensis]